MRIEEQETCLTLHEYDDDDYYDYYDDVGGGGGGGGDDDDDDDEMYQIISETCFFGEALVK